MRKNKKLSYAKKRERYGYLFILPWLIGFVFLFLRPLINSTIYSFSSIKLNHDIELQFAGLRYYMKAFVTDPNYLPKLAISLKDMAYQVPLILIFSLAVACVLNNKFEGALFFKAIFFLPVIIASGVVMSVISGDEYAQLMNSSLASSSLLGSDSVTELLINSGLDTRIVTAITKVTGDIFNLAWKAGIQILIFLSAFKSISPSIYEAAAIEGANGWESFWKITFPLISPMLLTNLIYSIIDIFTDYENPGRLYISDEAAKVNISYSAAMSWIYFIITFSIIMVIYFVVNKKVFYYID